MRSDLDKHNSALGGQVKTVQTLELRHTELNSRFNGLKKMADNYEWYRDGVKTIMQLHGSRTRACTNAPANAADRPPGPKTGGGNGTAHDAGVASIDIVGIVATSSTPSRRSKPRWRPCSEKPCNTSSLPTKTAPWRPLVTCSKTMPAAADSSPSLPLTPAPCPPLPLGPETPPCWRT